MVFQFFNNCCPAKILCVFAVDFRRSLNRCGVGAFSRGFSNPEIAARYKHALDQAGQFQESPTNLILKFKPDKLSSLASVWIDLFIRPVPGGRICGHNGWDFRPGPANSFGRPNSRRAWQPDFPEGNFRDVAPCHL